MIGTLISLHGIHGSRFTDQLGKLTGDPALGFGSVLNLIPHSAVGSLLAGEVGVCLALGCAAEFLVIGTRTRSDIHRCSGNLHLLGGGDGLLCG